MEIARPFELIGKEDSSIAGGKGASLGEMTRAGIPVPQGFVILTHAFERFLDEANLRPELEYILASVKHDQMHTAEGASEKIKARILAATIPDDIAQNVQASFGALDAEFVAVRSSATAEDGANAAWAGQLETYLNTTADDLLANVQRCWASLFTPRAIFYRFEKGMHGALISVAVVVQKMIQSEVSGIAFSVHPVTEDYNQLIIEAGFGLGEAIVTGQVTPDSFVVEKEPRRIIDKSVNVQNRALWRAGAGGNEWRELSQNEGEKPSLTEEQVMELASLVLVIEKHYGFPCDVEWAFEAGKFFITQSRPITTLSSRKRVAFAENMKYPIDPQAELLKWGPTPPYPMVRWSQCVTGFMNEFPKVFPGYTWPRLLALCDASRFIWIGDMKEMEEHGQKLFVDKMLPLATRESARADWEVVRTDMHACEARIASTNIPSLSDKELTDVWTEFNRRIELFWAHSCLPELSNYGSEALLRRELERCVPAEEMAIAMEVLAAPEGLSFYQQEEIDLLETADIVAHQQKYFWLRNSYAHVEVLPVDFFWSRKKDISIDIRQESKRRLEKVREEKDSIQKKYAIPKRVRDIADAIAEGIHWQDTRKRDIWVFLHYIEVLLEDIARRHGVDKKALSFGAHFEVAAMMQGMLDPLVLESRLEGTGVWAFDGTFTVLDAATARSYWKVYVDDMQKSSVQEFGGTIASKGKPVRGKVRIVLDPMNPGAFEKGDILVTTMTTPEFVFLMKKAAAVVTDTGSLTSHAAIVSRELGLPCIVATKVATQSLKNGDTVEVDANAGIVRKL